VISDKYIYLTLCSFKWKDRSDWLQEYTEWKASKPEAFVVGNSPFMTSPRKFSTGVGTVTLHFTGLIL